MQNIDWIIYLRGGKRGNSVLTLNRLGQPSTYTSRRRLIRGGGKVHAGSVRDLVPNPVRLLLQSVIGIDEETFGVCHAFHSALSLLHDMSQLVAQQPPTGYSKGRILARRKVNIRTLSVRSGV